MEDVSQRLSAIYVSNKLGGESRVKWMEDEMNKALSEGGVHPSHIRAVVVGLARYLFLEYAFEVDLQLTDKH